MRLPNVPRGLGLGLAGVVLALIIARPALKAGPPSAVIASASVGGAFGGGAQEESEAPRPVYLPARPMSREAAKTYAQLQEKVGMHFPNETTLEEIKKYFEEVTADKDDPAGGVPFFFEPQGLQDADKTMQSTVTIDFKRPVPLATSLRLIFDQVGLKSYIQEDGIVIVTAKENEDVPPDADHLILNTLTELSAEVKALRHELGLGRRRTAASSGGIGGGGGGAAMGAGGMGGMGGMM